jgi:hypothetical protein
MFGQHCPSGATALRARLAQPRRCSVLHVPTAEQVGMIQSNVPDGPQQQMSEAQDEAPRPAGVRRRARSAAAGSRVMTAMCTSA